MFHLKIRFDDDEMITIDFGTSGLIFAVVQYALATGPIDTTVGFEVSFQI